MGRLQVQPGLRSRRYQEAKVYKYPKKTDKYGPKMVAKKIFGGTASYEDLSHQEGFTADDFVLAWKPIFEQTDHDCTIPALNIKGVRWDLIDPIKISDALKRMKNSSPGPDGYRLKEILTRPIEQLSILLNLIMLYGPGKLLDGTYDSSVTFIKINEPTSPLDYRPIAVGNFCHEDISPYSCT